MNLQETLADAREMWYADACTALGHCLATLPASKDFILQRRLFAALRESFDTLERAGLTPGAQMALRRAVTLLLGKNAAAVLENAVECRGDPPHVWMRSIDMSAAQLWEQMCRGSELPLP